MVLGELDRTTFKCFILIPKIGGQVRDGVQGGIVHKVLEPYRRVVIVSFRAGPEVLEISISVRIDIEEMVDSASRVRASHLQLIVKKIVLSLHFEDNHGKILLNTSKEEE